MWVKDGGKKAKTTNKYKQIYREIQDGATYVLNIPPKYILSGSIFFQLFNSSSNINNMSQSTNFILNEFSFI